LSLADLTLKQLLDQTAARTPAPGGGPAAAVAGAIAAALTEMAANFAPDGGDVATATRARELRTRLLELADEDMAAYQLVIDVLALSSDDPGRPAALAGALSTAADPPLAIAEAAAEISELAARVAPKNKHLLGDATAGALLAEATTRAATRLVEINLEKASHDPRHHAAAQLAARAAAARASIDPPGK
jgi:formiminotetrahydrofolate cyclodeaminase